MKHIHRTQKSILHQSCERQNTSYLFLCGLKRGSYAAQPGLEFTLYQGWPWTLGPLDYPSQMCVHLVYTITFSNAPPLWKGILRFLQNMESSRTFHSEQKWESPSRNTWGIQPPELLICMKHTQVRVRDILLHQFISRMVKESTIRKTSPLSPKAAHCKQWYSDLQMHWVAAKPLCQTLKHPYLSGLLKWRCFPCPTTNNHLIGKPSYKALKSKIIPIHTHSIGSNIFFFTEGKERNVLGYWLICTKLPRPDQYNSEFICRWTQYNLRYMGEGAINHS